MRHFVIGDIHGHAKALDAILDAITPARDDRITLLGDYIDQGPASKAVLDTIMALGPIGRPIAGNHEVLMLAARTEPAAEREWLRYGGDQTLASFGVNHLSQIPDRYFEWMASLPWCLQDTNHVFVHAGMNPALPLAAQSEEDLLWLHRQKPVRLQNGKVLVTGHTPQPRPVITPCHIQLDTGIACGGLLSCLDLYSGGLIQADTRGELLARKCAVAA